MDNERVGIHAGDEESYEQFFGVFNPIILDYHALKDNFEHKTDMDVDKIIGGFNPAAPIRSIR